MGVYCRNDGARKLPPCAYSGISQAANATHTHTVVLCGLADVPSEQAVLHCSNEEGGNESGDRSDTEK